MNDGTPATVETVANIVIEMQLEIAPSWTIRRSPARMRGAADRPVATTETQTTGHGVLGLNCPCWFCIRSFAFVQSASRSNARGGREGGCVLNFLRAEIKNILNENSFQTQYTSDLDLNILCPSN